MIWTSPSPAAVRSHKLVPVVSRRNQHGLWIILSLRSLLNVQFLSVFPPIPAANERPPARPLIAFPIVNSNRWPLSVRVVGSDASPSSFVADGTFLLYNSRLAWYSEVLLQGCSEEVCWCCLSISSWSLTRYW